MTDIYPQFLKMRVQSTTDAYIEADIETPVIAGPNNYYIMNVLKAFVWAHIIEGDTQLVTLKRTGGVWQIVKDTASGLLTPTDDDIILFGETNMFTLTSGATMDQDPKVYDLTDGEGKGILISEKEIHLGAKADADSPLGMTVNAWLLYKMVKVSAQELLDMLQED